MKRILVALALLAASCGDDGDNKLFGSVSEVYPLEFDKVEASIVGQFLVVEYTKAATAQSAGKVAKLSLSNEGPLVVTRARAEGFRWDGRSPRVRVCRR